MAVVDNIIEIFNMLDEITGEPMATIQDYLCFKPPRSASLKVLVSDVTKSRPYHVYMLDLIDNGNIHL